jgi:hypothetical protein
MEDFPIIMERYGGHQTALNIALLGGFSFDFIMYLSEGPKLPLV